MSITFTDWENMTGLVSPSRPSGPERDAVEAALAACQRCDKRTATDRIGGLDVCNGCYEHILDMGSW